MNKPRTLLIESNAENNPPQSDLSRRGFLRKSASAAAAVAVPPLVGLGVMMSPNTAMAWEKLNSTTIDYRDLWMEYAYGYPNGVGLFQYLLNDCGYGNKWVTLEVSWRWASGGHHIDIEIIFKDVKNKTIGNYNVNYYTDTSNDLDVSKYSAIVSNLGTRKTTNIYPTYQTSSAIGEFRRLQNDATRYQYWVIANFKTALDFFWLSSMGSNPQYTRTITNLGGTYFNGINLGDYLGADSFNIIFHPIGNSGTQQDIVFRLSAIPQAGHPLVKYFAFPDLAGAESAMTKMQSSVSDANGMLYNRAIGYCGCASAIALGTAASIVSTSGWMGAASAAAYEQTGFTVAAALGLMQTANYAATGQSASAAMAAQISSARGIANSWGGNRPSESSAEGVFPTGAPNSAGYVELDIQWYIDNLNTNNSPNARYLLE